MRKTFELLAPLRRRGNYFISQLGNTRNTR